MITRRVVEDLGLQAEGLLTSIMSKGRLRTSRHTMLNLCAVVNDVHFADVSVGLVEVRNIDVLIGMDIINRGDFAVSNRDGATTFSFRIPSIETFDFVKEDGKYSR